MKDFLVNFVVCVIGAAVAVYPIFYGILFLFHRENDVSGVSMFVASMITSYVWMETNKGRSS